MTAIAPSLPLVEEPECGCPNHTIIHVTATATTPCKWNETAPLYKDSKDIPTPTDIFSATKQPVSLNLDFKLLFEEDGFMIETHPDKEKDVMLPVSDSWVTHYCPSLHWKVFMDSGYMSKYGLCHHCMEKIPTGVIALWKMHNWDALQNMDSLDFPPILGTDGLAAAYANMAAEEASCA